MIRIAIADYDPSFRHVLCQLLTPEEGFEVVAQAQDGRQVLDVLRQHEPDILLLDLKMQDLEATLRWLRAAKYKTRVIFLTSSDDKDEFVQAMKLGASGIVLKQTAMVDLILCICKVPSSPSAVESQIEGTFNGWVHFMKFATEGDGGDDGMADAIGVPVVRPPRLPHRPPRGASVEPPIDAGEAEGLRTSFIRLKET